MKPTFKEFLSEAGRVHLINKGKFPPRGAPEVPARAFDKPGTDRSVLFKKGQGKYHAIEFADEGEDGVWVLVMRDDIEPYIGKKPYYGINVIFTPDGAVHGAEANGDTIAAAQWRKDKEQIIKAAKDGLKDPDLSHAYDGLGGKSVKRGVGRLSVDIKD